MNLIIRKPEVAAKTAQSSSYGTAPLLTNLKKFSMNTKSTQGKLWSIAPEYWSRHFEPYFIPLYKKALSQLSISDDTLLLDAGCGSGLFTSMAIRRGAQVIGVDAAPGLLQVARLRNPMNNFLEEDLETMPFANESFDVITGFNSFQYAGDFANAVKESKRVLKKGGQLAIGIWDKPHKSDATQILKAISTLLPPPVPGRPGPFFLSEEGRVEGVLKELGLKLKTRTSVSCPFIYPTLADGVKSFMGTGPAAAALRYTTRSVVEKTIERALLSYRVTDDIYYQTNRFLLFIAEK